MNKEERERMAKRYTLSEGESPSTGVYFAISEIENCSPIDLPPLAETIDPDGLDKLLTGDTGSSEATLEYYGYELTVTREEILVKELDDE